MASINDNNKRLTGASGNQGASARNNTGLAVTPSSNMTTAQVLGADANQGQRNKSTPSNDGLLGSALPNVKGSNGTNSLTTAQVLGADANQGHRTISPSIQHNMVQGLTARQAIEQGSNVQNPNMVQSIGSSIKGAADYISSVPSKLGSTIHDITRQPLPTSSPSFTNNPATNPSNPVQIVKPQANTIPQAIQPSPTPQPTQPLLSNSGIGTTPTMSPDDRARQANSLSIVQRLGDGEASANILNSGNIPQQQQGNLGGFNNVSRGIYQPQQSQSFSDPALQRDLSDQLSKALGKRFVNTGLVESLLGGINGQSKLDQQASDTNSDERIATNKVNADGDIEDNRANASVFNNQTDNATSGMVARQSAMTANAKLGQDASQHEDGVSQLVMKNLLDRKEKGMSHRQLFTGTAQDLNGRPMGLDHVKNIFSDENYDAAMAKDEPGFIRHMRDSGLPNAYMSNILTERRAQFK